MLQDLKIKASYIEQELASLKLHAFFAGYNKHNHRDYPYGSCFGGYDCLSFAF